MKPDPDYHDNATLRLYVEEVAAQLGVEAAATWSEYGPPSMAYVALADRSPRFPGRFLMLQWTDTQGWNLALEPEGGEDPVVLAAWPDRVYPMPLWLAEQVQLAMNEDQAPHCAL